MLHNIYFIVMQVIEHNNRRTYVHTYVKMILMTVLANDKWFLIRQVMFIF